MRLLTTLLSWTILIVGLGLLNFTMASGWDHHAAWAAEHGLPGPSDALFRAGQVLTPLGGALVGWHWARRRQRNEAARS